MRCLIAVIGLAAVLYGADPVREQTLQKAIDLMESKGDWNRAVPLLQDAARSSDRAVAARALLYLARAQERQEAEPARATYLRITRDFGDQREVAAQARERLAALKGPAVPKPSGLTARRVDSRQFWGPHDFEPGTDGRSVVLVRAGSPDIEIRDVVTGEMKPLGLVQHNAGSNRSGEFAYAAVYSSDQRQIAYTWFSPLDHGYQLRSVSTEPGAKPRVLLSRQDLRYLRPYAWSSDGKAVVTLTSARDGTTSIEWVSATDGASKTLKVLEWRNPKRLSLSPDDRYIAYDALERPDGADRDIYVLAVNGTWETAAVKNPGIDDNPVWTPDGSHLVFTSSRSHNFGLYAIAMKDGKPQGEARLLKGEVGHVELRGFVNSGSLYYLQYTADQNIYKSELDAETGKLRSAAVPLTENDSGINDMAAVSPDGKSLAYLSDRNFVGEGPGAYTLMVKSLETKILRAYPVDLDVSDAPTWYADGRALLLGTDSEPPTRGRTFCKLDLETGRVTRLAHVSGFAGQDRWGLSRDGETLYLPGWDPGKSTGSVLALSLSTGQIRKLHETTKDVVATVALSPDGTTLAVGLRRDVLLMDLNGNVLRTITEAWGLGGGMGWSGDGKRLYFVRDSGAPQSQVWQIEVAGGEATLTGIQAASLRHMRTGGGALTYTAGTSEIVQLWAFDNLLPLLQASR